MTYTTDRSNRSYSVLPPHGGYRKLISYQTATIIYDFTVEFCKRYMSYKSNQSYRTYDQMVQAARSGKQNIVEGCQASGASKKTELKLLSVARASLEELLADYEDFLRQNNLTIWNKNDPRSHQVRNLSYITNRSYATYSTYMSYPASSANCAICLIHQANYLLDQQIRTVEKEFLEKGGLTERLYQARIEFRNRKSQL